MKTVNYRGVLVVFQIPEHWIEEHGRDGGATFFDPDDESVILRLNVTTLQSRRALRAADAVQALRDLGEMIDGPIEMLPSGQAAADTAVHHACERGTDIELRSFLIARVVPPHTVRIANFCTTVVPSLSHAAIIQPKLDAVREWVRACTIADAPPPQQPKRSWFGRLTGG